jgi:hypothetical protein
MSVHLEEVASIAPTYINYKHMINIDLFLFDRTSMGKIAPAPKIDFVAIFPKIVGAWGGG